MEEVQPTTWDVLKPLKSIVTNLAGCLSSIVARAFVPGFHQLFNHPLWNMKGIIHFWRGAVQPSFLVVEGFPHSTTIWCTREGLVATIINESPVIYHNQLVLFFKPLEKYSCQARSSPKWGFPNKTYIKTPCSPTNNKALN